MPAKETRLQLWNQVPMLLFRTEKSTVIGCLTSVTLQGHCSIQDQIDRCDAAEWLKPQDECVKVNLYWKPVEGSEGWVSSDSNSLVLKGTGDVTAYFRKEKKKKKLLSSGAESKAWQAFCFDSKPVAPAASNIYEIRKLPQLPLFTWLCLFYMAPTSQSFIE